MIPVLILGCGYTGQRVARRLVREGIRLIVTSRHPDSLRFIEEAGGTVIPLDLSANGAHLDRLRSAVVPGVRVLHSIPLIPMPAAEAESGWTDGTPQVLAALEDRAERIVYLSTTGVYGASREVDERTAPAPRTLRERLRVEAENAVAAACPSHLILRPAAIYGPGRGVQTAMRHGAFQLLGTGENYVSRIHVEDLAAHAEAALFSDLIGAFPVADEEPCTSRDIAEFCARLLKLPMPRGAKPSELGETRRADRRVDGSAIRHALGIELRFPSYRMGIPAALAKDLSATPFAAS